MRVAPKAKWALRNTIDALFSFPGSLSPKRNGFVVVAVTLLARRQLVSAPVSDGSLIDTSFTEATSAGDESGPSAQQNTLRVLDNEKHFHYFPQNDRGLHQLEFVHIPKTAGTSIEMAASRLGIAWGMCKFTEKRRRDVVPRCNDRPWPIINQIKMQRATDWECRMHGAPWHCPPRAYRGGNKFKHVKTFAVVRNPYDRMVSEYYYYFNRHPKEKKVHKNLRTGENAAISNLNDKTFMNEWILDALHYAKKKGHCYIGHCVTLAKYLFNEKDGTLVVSHVLKMENLTKEFEALMDLYQLPIRMEQYNIRKGNSTLGVEDLSSEAIRKINERFAQDFELFGYQMLDPVKLSLEN